MHPPPASIVPESEDWTWVHTRARPECGLDAGAIPVEDLAARVRASAATWRGRPAQPDARLRPAPATWSPLEHGAHVRDVLRLAHVRVTALLTEDDPAFADRDQDATAAGSRCAAQDPGAVAGEVEQAAEALCGLLDAVPAQDWPRPGRRSSGSVSTVASLGRCVLHHEEDVRPTGAPAQ